MRLVSATNLTAPAAPLFATFSFGGTELLQTDTVTPFLSKRTAAAAASIPTSTESGAENNASHVWTARRGSSCTIPLPEECFERREVEVEIDLWEARGPTEARGDHLGQVLLRALLRTVLSPVKIRILVVTQYCTPVEKCCFVVQGHAKTKCRPSH